MSWDAYVDSLKQRGMVHGAICGLDGSWFVASEGSKVRNLWYSLNGRVNNNELEQKINRPEAFYFIIKLEIDTSSIDTER